MRIDRLNIQISGSRADARVFGKQFQVELARCNMPSRSSGRIDRLIVPAITALPGEGPRQLAVRAARAVVGAIGHAQNGGRYER